MTDYDDDYDNDSDSDNYEFQRQEIIDGDVSKLSCFLDKYIHLISSIICPVIRMGKMHLLDLILSEYPDNINDYMYHCHYAADDDIFISSINIFLSHGADLHYKDDYFISCATRVSRIIFLINNGCNINAQNGAIFAENCRLGNIEVIEFMLTYNITNHTLNNGLLTAFKNSKFRIMKLLIENGADVSILNIQNSINADDEAVIQWLINNDVDPILMILASAKKLII